MEKLKQYLLDRAVKQIKKILEGNSKEEKLYFIKPFDVELILKQLNIEYEKDIETNGWQWDFWITYSLTDKSYTLAGTGYYEDYITFRTND